MAAKSCKSESVVALLLDGGANPNMGRLHGIADGITHSGMTPLHWAAFHGDKAILLKLLESGADTTKEDGNGQTRIASA